MVLTRGMIANMEKGQSVENPTGTGIVGQGQQTPQDMTDGESDALAIRRLELEFELRRLKIESEESGFPYAE